MRPLKIGVLNVMHDKQATNERLTRVLTHSGQPVELHFYYPTLHYPQGAPAAVAAILSPLSITEAQTMDAFIVTGAPLEALPFSAITYIDEVNQLFDALAAAHVVQLHLCWGGMAALAHFYGIEKHLLSHKLFGVYPHKIVAETPLLAGLQDGFKAPHARYAEMDLAQIRQHPQLTLEALTEAGDLLLVENHHAEQAFMFAHLEYGRKGLLYEYEREISTYPDRHYRQPENYFADPAHLAGPQFDWADTQAVFFDQWVAHVAEVVKTKGDK